MRRWAPWLLAFVVWNGAFDLQVRWAGRAFTSAQMERWRHQAPPELIRDALVPRVRQAAVVASGASAVALMVALAWARRSRPAAHQ
jgi:hypothetical protein